MNFKIPSFQIQWLSFVLVCLICNLIPNHQAFPQTIKLGGLFDISDPYEETAFRHAVMRVNSKLKILPSNFSAQHEILNRGDSYHASKQVCQLLKDGVIGLIGPQSAPSSSYVQSLCDVFGIPHIETKWDFRSSRGNFLINLYPHPANLSMAYSEIIKDYGWTRYIIIYENDESLIRLQDVLQLAGPDRKETVVKQLPKDSDDYRSLMKQLHKQYSDITSIIIDCDVSKLPKLFANAKEVGMTKHYYRYFITSLDIHTLNQDELVLDDVNITSFRLIDPENLVVQNIIKSWEELREIGFPKPITYYRPPTNFYDEVYGPKNFRTQNSLPIRTQIPILRNDMLRTETALIYDAVELFARALLHTLDSSQIQRFEIESLNCQEPKMWENGFLFLRNLKMFEMNGGLSGYIKLEDGRRKQFTLDVMELTQKGLTKIGEWDSTTKFNWTRSAEGTQKKHAEELENTTLHISTKRSKPYFMVSEDTSEFTGFSVDLINELAEKLKFKPIFKLVKDGEYGKKDARGDWNGCIGEILSGVADLAIGDMSITHERQSAVDFTMPFMNLGISILALKPHKEPPGLFSFLNPFHADVWIYMATAYLGVSLLLFILARMTPFEWQEVPSTNTDEGNTLEHSFHLPISLWFAAGSLLQGGTEVLPKLTPYEWLNPHPCDFSPKELELTLHLPNSLWFTIGSLMQQGSDIAPKINPNEWLNPNPTIENPDALELTLHVINSMWFTVGSIMQQGADTIPKLTPYQWLNPHLCKDDPQELVNDFTFLNSMWHNWCYIMQQGSDVAPKAGSTRMVAGIWWFFTLIMISSYTANLAAFLTSEGLEEGIRDVSDLPKQTKVKYGSVKGGSTTDFFKNSPFPLYKEIYKNMEAMKPSAFINSTDDGVNQVLDSKGSFVFFMESVTIEYRTERYCNLTQLGGLLDEKGYGIAFKKGSKYVDVFSSQIVSLSDQGKLQELKNKWWKPPADKRCKTEVISTGGATALSMGHVGGVFVVLIGGCAMACIMAFIEFFWKARKFARNEGESKWEEIKKELKFALQCQGDSKPVKKPKSLNPTVRSETGSVPYLFLNERKAHDENGDE